MSQRIQYLRQLVAHLKTTATDYLQQDQQHSDSGKEAMLKMMGQLTDALQEGTGFIEIGQNLLCHIVSHFPALTPTVPRDLFWLFGGDCLHYLSDEEIDSYQRLEDRLYEQEQAGKEVDFKALRAEVFGLH